MTTVVTTAYRPTAETIRKAQEVAESLGCRFAERQKRTIAAVQEEEKAEVVVAAKGRLEFYPAGKTEPFFFHPSSSAFRTKRPLEEDPLVETAKLEAGDSFLDCTLGMASDAIVAAMRVGGGGRVVGCESHPVISRIVGEGLQRYDGMPRLEAAMRRIHVVASDALVYLKGLEDNSFDVVYADPMFTEAIKESSNFSPIRTAADATQLSEEWVTEAKRVARKTVVLKAHFRSADFELYGFARRVRPNTKFHYGVIDLTAK